MAPSTVCYGQAIPVTYWGRSSTAGGTKRRAASHACLGRSQAGTKPAITSTTSTRLTALGAAYQRRCGDTASGWRVGSSSGDNYGAEAPEADALAAAAAAAAAASTTSTVTSSLSPSCSLSSLPLSLFAAAAVAAAAVEAASSACGSSAQAPGSGQAAPDIVQRLLGSFPACIPGLCLSALLLLGSFPAGALQPPQPPQHVQQAARTDLGSADLASALDEGLMKAAKQLGAGVDGAMSRLPTVPGLGGSSEEVAQATEAAHQLIGEVWQVVDDNYLNARGGGDFDRQRWAALRDKALARSYGDSDAAFRAVREMMARGLPSDPYSRFLTPGEFGKMAKYDVTGVGLNLGTGEDFTRKTGLPLPQDRAGETGGVWVLGLIKGGAADTGGLSQGDEVLEVGGRPVDKQSPFQVASIISGVDQDDDNASGDDVSGSNAAGAVQIKVRKPDGAIVQTEMARPKRAIPSPISYKLKQRADGAVGYVRLTNFNARAQSDLAAALSDLAAKGATEYVLDLRDNRGGLVTEGIEVARLFLDGDSTVVRQLGGQRMGPQVVMATGGPRLVTAPLTVLVNEATASASEILAGALKDNCRALLVGKQTYGKGLIQSVYELSGSSGLVLTVGKYLTPSGTDIDLGGIKPDFRSMPSNAAAEQALQACRVAATRWRGAAAAAPPLS